MLVVAAGRVHQNLNGAMSHLQFRREIVQALLGKALDKQSRPGPSKMPADKVKLTDTCHVSELASKDVANKKTITYPCARYMTYYCTPNAFVYFTNVCSKCPFLAEYICQPNPFCMCLI